MGFLCLRAIVCAMARLIARRTNKNNTDHFGKWAMKGNTRFQPLKCSMIQLTGKRNNKAIVTFSLEETVLDDVDRIKYVGVTATNDLKWNTLIGNIYVRAKRTLGFLMRKHFYDPERLMVCN